MCVLLVLFSLSFSDRYISYTLHGAIENRIMYGHYYVEFVYNNVRQFRINIYWYKFDVLTSISCTLLQVSFRQGRNSRDEATLGCYQNAISVKSIVEKRRNCACVSECVLGWHTSASTTRMLTFKVLLSRMFASKIFIKRFFFWLRLTHH